MRHEYRYFIPTKFHQNLSSGSGEEVENVKSLLTTRDGQTDGQTDGRTDRRTADDVRCAMTIGSGELKIAVLWVILLTF